MLYFEKLSAGDLRELLRVPLRGEGSCGVGGVHWDDPEGWNGEGGGRRVQDGMETQLPTNYRA